MNETTRGMRLHIGIFGRRNAGKSSLINALTGQETALVSPVAGTTTDPVYKAMELLPLGPVVLIDTAGLDDEGALGALRIERTREVLRKTELALLVLDAAAIGGETALEETVVEACRKQKCPVLLVVNKTDSRPPEAGAISTLELRLGLPAVAVSALAGTGIMDLKEAVIRNAPEGFQDASLLGDIIKPGELAVLVVPIDDAAPKGRLILPQVQVIRELLDLDALAMVVKERELAPALERLSQKPRIVITDSQAFRKVAADTPDDVLLTSFSILFARYKGDLAAWIEGIRRIETLADGDRILIAEACTHHVQSDDIGTVKIPRWLREATGKNLVFEKCAGNSFPADLAGYALVIHCGGCMINRQESLARIGIAAHAGLPITNYGLVIAWCFGILRRALAPFPHALAMLDGQRY